MQGVDLMLPWFKHHTTIRDTALAYKDVQEAMGMLYLSLGAHTPAVSMLCFLGAAVIGTALSWEMLAEAWGWVTFRWGES